MKHFLKNVVMCLLVGLVGLTACSGCDPEFKQDGPRAQPGAMSSCDSWKVTSQGGSFNFLQFAHDNNMMTVCKSSSNYANASIIIDFGRPCYFNTIAIPHGIDEFGYVRRLDISISNDGKKYQKIYEGVGTRKVTYINILTPVSARYVKLTARRPGHRAWSIAEIYFQ